MGSGKRTALLALASAAGLLAVGPCEAAASARKSVQDCGDELREKAAAIDAAGMSPSAFFHACWWHTEPGTPTPIVADERAKRPFQGVARTSAAMRVPGRPAPDALVAMRRPARFATRRRLAPARADGSDADEGAVVVRAPSRVEAAPDAVFVPRAPETGASGAVPAMPREVRVGVPVIGQLSLPVVPVLAPTVRAVVDHQLVPGLVTAVP